MLTFIFVFRVAATTREQKNANMQAWEIDTQLSVERAPRSGGSRCANLSVSRFATPSISRRSTTFACPSSRETSPLPASATTQKRLRVPMFPPSHSQASPRQLPAPLSRYIRSRDESPWVVSPAAATTYAPPSPIPFLPPSTVKRLRVRPASDSQQSVFSSSAPSQSSPEESTPQRDCDLGDDHNRGEEEDTWSERWAESLRSKPDSASALVFAPLVDSLQRDGFSPQSCRLAWTTLALQSSLEAAPAMERLQTRMLNLSEPCGSAPASTLEWMQRLKAPSLELTQDAPRHNPLQELVHQFPRPRSTNLEASMLLLPNNNHGLQCEWIRLACSAAGVLDLVCVVDSVDTMRQVAQQLPQAQQREFGPQQLLWGRALAVLEDGTVVDCKFVASSRPVWVVQEFFSRPRAQIQQVLEWGKRSGRTASLQDFYSVVKSANAQSWRGLLRGMSE